MKTKQRHNPMTATSMLLALGMALGAMEAAHAWTKADFNFTTIDVPNSVGTVVNGNSTNAIAGNFLDSSGNTHGFVLTDGVYKTIDYPDASYTSINGINWHGQITGTYTDNTGVTHAFFLAENGQFTSLDPYQGSTRTQGGFINSQGQAVGTYRGLNDYRSGFIWSNDNFTKTDINCPGDDPVLGTVVFGVNDYGQVVGDCVTSDGNRHGFLLSEGVYTTFDPPGASLTIAEGINNHGKIVGLYIDNTSAQNEHGFILSNGRYKTIDMPNATYTAVYSINADGEIVGAYGDAAGIDHGFVGTPINMADQRRHGDVR